MSQYPPGSRRSAARKQHRPVSLRDYWAVPATVLVIEDDQATAEMIGIVLSSQGMRPHWAGTGERAVAEFLRLRPRLVLLDMVLPDTDGVAVCRAIRSVSATPIVVVSATRDPEMIEAVTDSGADDYLLKPFTIRQLSARVDAHLPASAAPALLSLPSARGDSSPARALPSARGNAPLPQARARVDAPVPHTVDLRAT